MFTPEELREKGLKLNQEVENTEKMIDITEYVDLKAYIKEDNDLGMVLIISAGRGQETNTIGLFVHPTMGDRIVKQFNKKGKPK